MTKDDSGHINTIDLCLCEAEGIVDVLLHIRVEADPAQHQALNGACVTLLHVALERLRKASARLDALKAAA
ncbi:MULTISPECIES: hypothetical protein [unclassified Mesorhizobium]|uniref:hypothetical protein n=1 Tax=unclassified Mesorhizobium TaxID=325217 RepID=UPI001128E89E|nr:MULTISPECIES: hypothetical protein [unclassified Mesorhizobium]TPM06798.1 hypothetical protein FJ939_12095 [Mesorhizobium sp. B2-3-8]TPM15319.1 hypothetical protein FJ940_14010 [Mesorhizobium sp. B2-3-7]